MSQKPQQVSLYRVCCRSTGYNKDHKVQNLLAYVILKDGVREQFERDIRYYQGHQGRPDRHHDVLHDAI